MASLFWTIWYVGTVNKMAYGREKFLDFRGVTKPKWGPEWQGWWSVVTASFSVWSWMWLRAPNHICSIRVKAPSVLFATVPALPGAYDYEQKLPFRLAKQTSNMYIIENEPVWECQ